MGAAQLAQPLGGADPLGVDVLVRTELADQLFLVGAARDRDGPEA